MNKWSAGYVLLLIVIALFGVYCVAEEKKLRNESPNLSVEWIGHPMVSDNDSWTPSQGWVPTVQIGLREDGVVVWRKTNDRP